MVRLPPGAPAPPAQAQASPHGEPMPWDGYDEAPWANGDEPVDAEYKEVDGQPEDDEARATSWAEFSSKACAAWTDYFRSAGDVGKLLVGRGVASPVHDAGMCTFDLEEAWTIIVDYVAEQDGKA